jgi:hypothetical protein
MDPEGLDELVHPAGRNTSEVAVRDHCDQGRLWPFPSLEEPLWEVGAGAQLGDGDIDRTSTSIELAVSVTIAVRDAGLGAFTPFRTDDSISVSREEGVDHRLQQVPHQIRRRVGQGFTENGRGVDNMWSGHRDDAFRVGCESFLEGSHGGRAHVVTDAASHRELHHYAGRDRGHFPNEQSALKVMYLAIIERRHNRANPTGEINGWKAILNTLAMTYGDRLGLN